MSPAVCKTCILVFEDNEGSGQLAQNPITNPNPKHIDVRHHLFRELVGKKEVTILHMPSHCRHAVFLTKAIALDSLEFHRNLEMDLLGVLISLLSFWVFLF